MANKTAFVQVGRTLKFLIIAGMAILGASCGGGGGSCGGSGGGGTPQPTPVAQVQQVNISNISAIPVTGNQTNTSLVVTNNTQLSLVLTSAVVAYGSKTATLNLSGANDTFAGAINVSQCGTLQANGTCSVMITPPPSTGSYLITLTFTGSFGSKTYTASQVVTYSNAVPSSPGFTYSNLNNNVYVPTGGSSYMVIPFILDHDTTQLYAYSNTPGAVVPNLVCSGGTTYSRGDLCTVYVRVGNLGTATHLIANVTVSDSPNPNPGSLTSNQGHDTKKIKQLAGSTGYSFTTPVSVTTNNVGNLVSSAFNPVINPANSTAPVTITLLNNGIAPLTISNLSIATGSPVTISGTGGTPCVIGTVLAANGACTYQVNANTTTSGQSAAYIGYTNGSSSSQLIYTVVYISAAPGPGMSLTAAQGSLQNALVGTTSTLTVNVSNTGTTLLTNISFTAQSSLPAGITYDTANSTCSTAGAQTLAAGAKCTLILRYLPSAAQATASFNLSGIATYTDQGGTSQTYSGAYLVVQYSAFTSLAFVYMVPNYTSYAIRADNTDSATQVITLVNSGGQSTTLSSPSYTLTSFPTGAVVLTDGCAGFTLTANGGASCNITVKYGPVTAVQASTSGRLNVAYPPGGGLPNVTAFATEVFQAQSAALVSVSAITKTGATGGAGSGTSGSPYTFINAISSGYPIIITFTYQNTGTDTAKKFAVNLSNLPVGYALSGAPTCGTGANPVDLSSGSSCTVAVAAMNPAASPFWNPYAFSGPLNINIPGYSYNDTSTGVNTNTSPTFSGAPTSGGSTVYVTANSFATLSGSGGTHPITGSTFNVTFTSTAGAAALYPVTITIPPTSLTTSSSNSVYLPGANTCTISTVTGNCTISITNNPNSVAAVYTYAYWVTPTGLTPSLTNSLIQYFSFTLN